MYTFECQSFKILMWITDDFFTLFRYFWSFNSFWSFTVGLDEELVLSRAWSRLFISTNWYDRASDMPRIYIRVFDIFDKCQYRKREIENTNFTNAVVARLECKCGIIGTEYIRLEFEKWISNRYHDAIMVCYSRLVLSRWCIRAASKDTK